MQKFIYIFIECKQGSSQMPSVFPFSSLCDAVSFKAKREQRMLERLKRETINVNGEVCNVYDSVKLYNSGLSTDYSQLVAYHYLHGRKVIDFYITRKEFV